MIVVVLLLLLALAPGSWSTKSPSENNASANAANSSAAPAVTVQTAKVEVRDLQRSVEAVGTLDPNEEIGVSNQVEGLVAKIFVDPGDFVKAGKVIAQLDTVVMGGQLLCLLLTLLFTPVAYSIFDDIVARFRTKPHEA